MKILKKIFFVIWVLSFLESCGYQPLLSSKNQKFSVKDISQEIKKKPSNELKQNNRYQTTKKTFNEIEITQASPQLEEIKNLINLWLQRKSNYLSG